ncbi:MAG TPA: hypothetical protein VK812_14110 [Candidatus Binatus sp.]|nr:hypothetical protein [Candidatus Binatus sp.]
MPNPSPSQLRYDAVRQVAQVLQDDRWIDTPDASASELGATRKTAVAQETFDDE